MQANEEFRRQPRLVRQSKVQENDHRAAAIVHERLAAFYIRVALRLLDEAEAQTRFAQRDWEYAERTQNQRSCATSSTAAPPRRSADRHDPS